GVTITLALKPILQGLLPSQIDGDVGSVSAEAQIEIPFSLIEPQLAAGRVAIAPAVLAARLPAEYRNLFKASEAADVMLPLHEVLKNLPTSSLRMRDDQVTQEAGVNIATPFSAKAEEDAKRFNIDGVTPAEPLVTPPTPVEEAPAAAPPTKKPFDLSVRNPLQVALETDEKLDNKAVIAQLNTLAGVKGCALMFGDGLSLAGSLPAEF